MGKGGKEGSGQGGASVGQKGKEGEGGLARRGRHRARALLGVWTRRGFEPRPSRGTTEPHGVRAQALTATPLVAAPGGEERRGVTEGREATEGRGRSGPTSGVAALWRQIVRTKAESQRIVATRPLCRVQYPVPYSSRLQVIHRAGSGNCDRSRLMQYACAWLPPHGKPLSFRHGF